MRTRAVVVLVAALGVAPLTACRSSRGRYPPPIGVVRGGQVPPPPMRVAPGYGYGYPTQPPPPPPAVTRGPSFTQVAPPPPPMFQAPPPPPTPGRPSPPLLAGPITDPAAAMLARVDATLLGSGFRRMGSAMRGHLATSAQSVHPFDAQPGLCYTVVAVGGPGVSDIDLLLYSPYGLVVARDVRTDNHPIVRYCTTQTGRFGVRVTMYAGAGAYYLAMYASGREQDVDLAAVFAAPPGVAVPPPTPVVAAGPAAVPAEVAARLQQVDAQMAQQGLRRSGATPVLQMQQRETQRIPIELAGGRCYAFATFGAMGARDTDVFLYDHRGRRVRSDGATALDALVERYCPEATQPHQIEVRMYNGPGLLVLAAYESATAGPELFLPTVGTAPSAAPVGPVENFRAADADLRSRGYEPIGAQATGSLQTSQSRDYTLPLENDTCYAVLAVGEATVETLSLSIVDPRGRIIDTDAAGGATPVVRACPEAAGPHRVLLRMEAGQGAFIYHAYRWPRGTSGPFGLHGMLYVRMSEMTTMLAPEQLEIGGPPDVATLPARAARSRAVELANGQCYALVAVGGQGVREVELVLRRGQTEVLRSPGGASFSQIRHCPGRGQGGRHHLVVRVGDPGGEVLTQVYERSGGP